MFKKLTIVFLLFSINYAYGRVYTGLEVFLYKYTHIVKNKRVGLVTNPTGVNYKLQSTIDLLYSNPNINLVALFAPEHGVRGNVRAGENVKGGNDKKTGLPVYTLYGGKDHRPKKKDLQKIDILIYDIQDIGSRAYTYIWHLAECMSAAAEAGKTVIVLDRPNPLGANVVDGPISEKKYLSFIGLYPIPRVYGMTVGELARYLNIEEKIKCKLYVVPMKNYRRSMNWKETELPWVPTSPQIPTPQSAYCFAATGTIGELGVFNIGIGYTLPFQTVATPWINAEYSSNKLNTMKLPGIIFRPIYYRPYFALYKGSNVHGVQLHIIDSSKFLPATTELAILFHFSRTYSRYFVWKKEKFAIFDKAMGTSYTRKALQQGFSYNNILNKWKTGHLNYLIKRRKYLIYK